MELSRKTSLSQDWLSILVKDILGLGDLPKYQYKNHNLKCLHLQSLQRQREDVFTQNIPFNLLWSIAKSPPLSF